MLSAPAVAKKRLTVASTNLLRYPQGVKAMMRLLMRLQGSIQYSELFMTCTLRDLGCIHCVK